MLDIDIIHVIKKMSLKEDIPANNSQIDQPIYYGTRYKNIIAIYT